MYLLDVNVLVAFWYRDHTAHRRVARWIRHELRNPEAKPFRTCAIVELGFIRVASGSAGFAETVENAREDLRSTKAHLRTTFLNDEVEGERQPSWVTKASQTTDGHLFELAKQHNLSFATLDRGIRGATLLPAPDLGIEVKEPAPAYADNRDTVDDDPSELLIYHPDEALVPGYPFPRWAICPISGYPHVRSRPGARKVTNEEVREALEDFP